MTSLNHPPDAEQAPTNPVGAEMYALVEQLYPICRSITGEGVRETLRILQTLIPLEIHEVPSGTPVFDWTIPREWNIRDACIMNLAGERVVDFRNSNLHVLNYSVPMQGRISLEELQTHLFSLPEQPELIPYRTSYYQENWGFCLSQQQRDALVDPEYDVLIDSTLSDGHLTWGEYFVPGETTDEILISCHVCHPSLCNDNLSGIVLATFLARSLAARQTRYSYRFLFIPGTIGSIAWLALNEMQASRIRHGLVAVCVGDRGMFTYKRSRRGDAEIDRMVEAVLAASGHAHQVKDFHPYGYDERQYCSPGFNLAVGSLSRSSHGTFPEYHTSADDLNLVSAAAMAESLAIYQQVLEGLELNRTWLNLQPKCEPQLGKRGLYNAVGAATGQAPTTMAMLWVLNLSDGEHSLLDIATRSGLPLPMLADAATALADAGLLRDLSGGSVATASVISPPLNGSASDVR